MDIYTINISTRIERQQLIQAREKKYCSENEIVLGYEYTMGMRNTLTLCGRVFFRAPKEKLSDTDIQDLDIIYSSFINNNRRIYIIQKDYNASSFLPQSSTKRSIASVSFWKDYLIPSPHRIILWE